MRSLVALILIAACASFTWASECFDDKKMALMQQETRALLYVWSPRMVLSAQHAASVAQQAREQGLRFVAMYDARVPADEVDAALRSMAGSGVATLASSASSLQNSRPLCANTLLERDALRHFPTAFVLLPSGPHRHPIVGAMPPEAWTQSLRQRLAQPIAAAAVQ
jgi:hypothetical protein